jgi:catechol 2,3-dioxygenase-like lactoylglutathione lyase family enzyme
MITGIAHVNLTVPPGTLEQAAEFYGTTLGLTRVAVPVLQKDTLAWYCPFHFLLTSHAYTHTSFLSAHIHPTFHHPSPLPPTTSPIHLSNNQRFDITPHGQQIHISSASPLPNEPTAARHPCFKLESAEKLQELREKIWAHFEKGGKAAPMAADKPGAEDSGE